MFDVSKLTNNEIRVRYHHLWETLIKFIRQAGNEIKVTDTETGQNVILSIDNEIDDRAYYRLYQSIQDSLNREMTACIKELVKRGTSLDEEERE